MSDTVRRVLGVVTAIALLVVAGVWSNSQAELARTAALSHLREAQRAQLGPISQGLMKLPEAVADQAVSFAGIKALNDLFAEVAEADDQALVATIANAVQTEPWTASWNEVGTIALAAKQQLIYQSNEAQLPPLKDLLHEATTSGRARALVPDGDRLLLIGMGLVPTATKKQQRVVAVLIAPLDQARLSTLAKSLNVSFALFVGKTILFGGDPAHLGDLRAAKTDATLACCSTTEFKPGVTLAVWTNAQPMLTSAEADASQTRLISLGVAGVLGALALVFAFRSKAGPSEEHTQLLKETAVELQKSREELLKLSQRISSPGLQAPPLATTVNANLDQTAASIATSRYEVVAPLGEGGMARVSVAQVRGAEGFRRLFVVKRLRPEMVGNAEIVSQFIDEARLGASLVHSNIVPVFDFGRDAEGYFLAQEYILGRDIDAMIRESRAKRGLPLEPAVVLYMAQEALKALSYAHTKRDDLNRPMGLVHRDVSPNNLMLTARGELKLLDFGIVKSEQRLTKTQTGVVKGNLFFMSPEQARALPVDARSDLFSLGMVLYNAVTGDTLYHGETSYELLTRSGLGPTAADFELISKLPGGLAPLITRALQTDPAARFQNAEEFALAVAEAGPIATAVDLQTLMEWLFRDSLAAETNQFSRTNS